MMMIETEMEMLQQKETFEKFGSYHENPMFNLRLTTSTSKDFHTRAPCRLSRFDITVIGMRQSWLDTHEHTHQADEKENKM